MTAGNFFVRQNENGDFPENATSANPVYFRTYSRFDSGTREQWGDTCARTVDGIAELGQLTDEEKALLYQNMRSQKCLPSGRWMWIGGTEWIKKPENYYGAYNCNSSNITDWQAFGLMMNLAMQGCGTGANLEIKYIEQLPKIINKLNVKVIGEPGLVPKRERYEETQIKFDLPSVYIKVGDSRNGWVESYQFLLELSSNTDLPTELDIIVDVSNVRPKGERLKSFGGVANPNTLKFLYQKVANILNDAQGRKLDSLECCLLIDEAASVVVAGNIRRSAGLRQFSSIDTKGTTAKDNLWQQNGFGQWVIDPKRDALRMANHTRVFHHKPSKDECISAVTKQYYSGEGAIQWAGEAVARANADLLETSEEKQYFLSCYNHSLQNAQDYLLELMVKKQIRFNINELTYRMNLYGTNPCGEIILQNNFCNLSEIHLNQIEPLDFEAQEQAFKAGALWVAALLHHKFVDERYQKGRELDPIVGVGFTGLFDFFVNAFGVDWLRWWQAGRPDSWGVGGNGSTHYYLSDFYKTKEQNYLEHWSKIVHKTVWEYCDRHNLKRPNRCTTTKPSGSQSLLTGASPGWHCPKAAYFIRRVTYAKNDPVALACVDFGYSITPSQSDKDENGVLLNDPYDPRCTEWLVEIPTKTNWADLDGVENIDISQFSALAQFDFYMQVQKHYATHNVSATIELRESEIEGLGERIYQAIQNDEGYISAALLARFDDYQSYPRLPFEPVSREEYNKLNAEVLARRKTNNFKDALAKYDTGLDMEVVLVACDGGKCELKQN